MIVIGSVAAKRRGIDLRREPGDIDFVMNDLAELSLFDDVSESKVHPGMFHARLGGMRAEIDGTRTEANLMLGREEGLCDRTVSVNGLYVGLPAVRTLYLIKRSHAGHDIHWEKTMFDLQCLKQCIDLETLSDVEKEFYRLHKADCDVRYAASRPRINYDVPNEEFFTETVDRVYEHDWLHQIVKYRDKPMYQYLKRDHTKAVIDRDLFEALPIEEKYFAVKEEIMVIAMERFLIPGKVTNPKIAFRQALRLVLLRLAPDFFQDFMIDHYYDEGMKCDMDYWNMFKKEIKDEYRTTV